MVEVTRPQVLAEHALVAAALASVLAVEGESQQEREVLLIHLGTVSRAGAEFLAEARAAASAAVARGVPVVVIAAGQLPGGWPGATVLPTDVAPEVLRATIRDC